MIELAMPAGSIQSALVAFRDGADAIYLGLQSFSARKSAVNFTIEEYSKIFAYAKSNNKKVYVTINTVIYDAQLSAAIKLLKQIQLIGSDGIIVQDLGIAKIIREFFPKLPLHGSTQLAVHSVMGVESMAKLGFTRVVLSRELTIEEIENIRMKCPDIELKVFIHGALCYGFSGLCMASRLITKRSANAGACAQICRTWFESNNQKGYFFSMKDLNAGESVKKLRDIGIDSLKVEGRMKSPAYVSSVTKYYRAIIDNKDYKKYEDDVRTSFSRTSSKGWLDNFNNDKISLIDKNYSSHKGLLCAKVIDKTKINNNDYAYIQLKKSIAIHDGLLFFDKQKEIDNAVRFTPKVLLNREKKEIKKTKDKDFVYILLTSKEKNIQIGDDVFLIRKHDQDEKLINIDRMPFSKIFIEANVVIEDTSISVESDIPYLGNIFLSNPIQVDEAKKVFDYQEKIENIFKQSQDSYFEVDSIKILNKSKIPLSNIFLPLSEIKNLRRAFYEIVDKKVKSYIDEEIKENIKKVENNFIEFPNRSLIKVNQLPFYEEIPTSIEDLILIEDKYFIPLPPVFFNEEIQLNNLNKLISNLIDNNLIEKTYFGINNIAHLKWLENKNLQVFIDIYLYLANRYSALSILDLDLNLCGAYLFLETVKGDISKWPFIPMRVDEEFLPPLFISRTNFSFDSLGKNKEIREYNLSQRDQEYKVISNKNLTYLIKKN